MAFYSGTVKADLLFTTIRDLITRVHPGEAVAWWVNESSLASDGVYTSTGSTGNERIVLVFREGIIGQYFDVGMARDYTPGAINTAGAFDTLEIQDIHYFNATKDPNVDVSYNLSVTPDRVIIHIQGDKLISGWQNTVMFLGMPFRYDINDKKFVIKAASEDALHSNTATVLENSIGQTLYNYSWYYVSSPGNPSWGNTFFIETLHLGHGAEGLRGELDGLYGSHDDGLVDGDEIDVNGTRFVVIKRNAYGLNAFPRNTLLMRKE